MTPTVSVVIPTFNRSTPLINAIESVLKQTYEDYEIIVIDDGSTDDTRDRLRPYGERIRYFYQDNRGAGAARNKGIQVARGKWLSMLDSDDVWLPTKLERQLKALTIFGNEFGACFTDCTYVGSANCGLSSFEEAGLKTRSEFGRLDDPIKYSLGRYALILTPSLLVRRSLLKELNGFDEALVIYEDTDLIFRLVLKTRLCFVATPQVKIDRHASRPRLTDLASQRGDQTYALQEYMLRKWLNLPEVVDLATRQIIHDHLRLLYYTWIAARLSGLRFAGALQRINDVRATGDNYPTILFTLLSRAARRVIRAVEKLDASSHERRAACKWRLRRRLHGLR